LVVLREREREAISGSCDIQCGAGDPQRPQASDSSYGDAQLPFVSVEICLPDQCLIEAAN
jgi:hypothetical protein